MVRTNYYFINIPLSISLFLITLFHEVTITLGISRPVSIVGVNADLSSGFGLSVPFFTGSTLEYTVASVVAANKANINILAVNLNGQAGGVIKFTGDDNSLGSVISQVLFNPDRNHLFLEINDTNLTLTGTSSALGFASGINFAQSNDYSALGEISFVGVRPVLTINAPITLDGTFGGLQIANATLNINSHLKATDQTVAEISTINISENSAFTIDATKSVRDIALANGTAINFIGRNSKLKLTHADKINDHAFILNSDVVGKGDNQGVIELASDASGKKLIINPSIAETLGTTTHRLKELIISGAGETVINVGTRVHEISILGTGNVTFLQKINSGDNSSMLFGEQSCVEFNEDTNITNISFADNDGTIKIKAGKKLISHIMANNPTVGTLEFVEGGELDGVISNLKMLKAGHSADVKLASGNHTIAEIRATGSKKLIFLPNFNLNGKIDDFSGGNAIDLNFEGSSIITGTIGETNPLGNVNILGKDSSVQFDSNVNCNTIAIGRGSKLILGGGIIANQIVSDNAIIKVNNNIIIKSNIYGKDTTLDIGSNKLTYNGAAVLEGNVLFNIDWNAADKNIGHLVVQGPDSNLNLSNSVMTINLTSDANPEDVIGKNYVLLKTADGGSINSSKSVTVISNESNNEVVWTYNPETYSIEAHSREVQQLPGVVKASNAFVSDSFQNLSHQTKAMHHAISNVTKATVKRLSHITNFVALDQKAFSQEDSEITGVAAGEETPTPLGVWSSIMYNISNQKQTTENSGYRARSAGKSIGIDKAVNDSTFLGGSLTIFNTNINAKSGNNTNTRVDTSMLSVYGLHLFQKNFFTEAVLAFAENNVKQRITNSRSYESLEGRYKSNFYVGEILFGYKHGMPANLAITPKVGLRYTLFKDPAYKITGSNTNLLIEKKSTEKLDVIGGVTVATIIAIKNDIVLTPELHGLVNHKVAGKSFKLNTVIENSTQTLPSSGEKGKNTVFNTGIAMSLKYNNIVCRISYDNEFSKGYVGHQGVLKILLNI